MSEKKDDEIYYRSQAFKFFDKGKSNKESCKRFRAVHLGFSNGSEDFKQQAGVLCMDLRKLPSILFRHIRKKFVHLFTA
jgi:hypothetical protein